MVLKSSDRFGKVWRVTKNSDQHQNSCIISSSEKILMYIYPHSVAKED